MRYPSHGVGSFTSQRFKICSKDEGEGGRSMYKLGETFQRDGFLELRQEGDLYLLSLGDCFDDGGEGVCMPLFSFTKKLSRERVEALIKYLEESIS
jgi:hypothetical protein